MLDQSQSGVGFATDAGVDPARLNAVHAVLHLLDHMPAADPSADLMSRLMSRVSADEPTTALPAFRPGLGGQQAHA